MSKADKILIGVILLISLLACLRFSLLDQKNATLTAEISVNGQIVSKVNLNEVSARNLINISGPFGKSVAEVKPGAIRMKFSPCPDHYCMQTGWINKPGQLIACIPNQIIIKIKTADNSVDTISN